MPFTWRRLTGIPHVRDVGATAELADLVPGQHRPVYYAGSDGSLWQSDTTTLLVATQVPSPGDIVRVSVAANGDVWCVDARDALWRLRGTTWSRIEVPNERVRDVDVARDGTVYLVMGNGRYYSIVPGGVPTFHGVFIVVQAIAGAGRPSDADPFGQAWGVSPTFGDGALCRCQTVNGWSDTNIRNVVDLSIARDGAVWMTKSDGTSWTTTDGVTQLRMGSIGGLVRLAAHSFAITLAVAADGTAWSWENIAAPPPVDPPPPPPPPSLPPPPQGTPAPRLSVTTSGSGESAVFTVTGSSFLRSVQVTIMGTRIADGAIHQFFWTTTSDGDGEIRLPIDLPCVPGLVINFAANDGRRNPADLTDRLWSNTVQAACPGA